MFKKIIPVTLLLGCQPEADSNACIFEGKYEVGYLAYESPLDCSSNSAVIYGTGEDECSTNIDQLGPTGARQLGYVSCDPGDPIVECLGYMGDSDGCQWEIYVRRIVTR